MNSKNDSGIFDLFELEKRFVDAWKAKGDHPQISDFVKDLSDENCQEALQVLIPIDIQHRFQNGQNANAEVYESVSEQAVQIARELFVVEKSLKPPTRNALNDSSMPIGSNSWDPLLSSRAPKNLITDRYRLLHKIGQGGMGAVWMAQQEKPMRRRVAIKIIGKSLDSEEALGRFSAERQALAMMNHPNIAKVMDAGYTEDDRPFFAMELVKGVPITHYCNDNQLTIEQRLKLLVQVCKAVQHAHQKGIIHRDLKPSNILVTFQEGFPVPKVIDFGLAKALEHSAKLTDQTVVTEFGRVVGTIQYMSPEQANSNQLDVDTRTDVYSLGVILYQLMTDVVPLERDSLTGKSLIQIVELIRDLDVVRPSKRLAIDVEQLQEVCTHRKTSESQLIRKLEGELDWVVLKSLQRDRVDRYQTANALAADVERFLNNEPVVARPLSRAYLFSKFVSRNRKLVSLALAASTLLLILTCFSLWSWFRAEDSLAVAKHEKENADIAKREAVTARELAETKEEEAKKERKMAEARLDLLDLALTAANPKKGAGKFATSLDFVNKTNAELNKNSVNLDPTAIAKTRLMLAKHYFALGEYAKSIELSELATQVFSERGDAKQEIEALLNLIQAQVEQHKNLSNEEKAPDKIIQLADRLYEKQFDGEPTRAKFINAILYFAAYKEEAKVDAKTAPESWIKKSISIFQELKEIDDVKRSPGFLFAVNANLANAYLKKGSLEEVQRSREILEEILPTYDISTDAAEQNWLRARNNYGETLFELGELEKAANEFREVLKLKREHFCAWHDDIRVTVRLLYGLYRQQANDEAATKLIDQWEAAVNEDLENLTKSPKEDVEKIRANFRTLLKI